MRLAIVRSVPIALLFFAPAALPGAPPRPAPRVYATHNYVLTFRTPPGATYCPLPAGWRGSDHGTTVFLERPRICGAGAGYPSTDRSFAPGNVARINLFYVYRPLDPMPPVRCRRVGRLVLLGRARPLCRTDENGMIRITVEAPYMADIAAEAALTLVTRRARLAGDLATFRRVAASLRTCRATWRERRRPVSYGSGPPCPRAGTF